MDVGCAAANSALRRTTRFSKTQQQFRIEPGSKIYIEESDFGKALAAAILKKKVPVVINDKSKASYVVQTTSAASQVKKHIEQKH